MSKKYRRRWSDSQRSFGPFVYSRDKGRLLEVDFDTGDGEERDGNSFRLSFFGHTFIVYLPTIIPPYREKVKATYWDAATIERIGRDWYWDTENRRFGFCIFEGASLHYHFGRQSDSSLTDKTGVWFFPWRSWRHVRFSLYGLKGEHFWTQFDRDQQRGIGMYDEQHKQEELCPSITFKFNDFDGEEIEARTIITEREWQRGEGKWRWLSKFYAPKIIRSLAIEFSKETGPKKGSWKGGTIGHSIEMLPGELHKAAFRRYCAEHKMTIPLPEPPK